MSLHWQQKPQVGLLTVKKKCTQQNIVYTKTALGSYLFCGVRVSATHTVVHNYGCTVCTERQCCVQPMSTHTYSQTSNETHCCRHNCTTDLHTVRCTDICLSVSVSLSACVSGCLSAGLCACVCLVYLFDLATRSNSSFF